MATDDTSKSLFLQAVEQKIEEKEQMAAIISDETIEDWRVINGAYCHKDEIYRSCTALEVDARIPARNWEWAIDENGEVLMRNNKPQREKPSQTLMRRMDLRFSTLAFNPTEGETFSDTMPDGSTRRCYNTWRGVAEPPEPEQIVSPQFWIDLVNHVYPVTGILLIKSLAHLIQKPWESPQIHHILDGGQGAGKDFILDIAQWSISRQKLTADITVTDVTAPFQPWLKSICVNVNEFYVQGKPDKQMMNFFKSITTTPPMTISCNDKMEKAVQVTKVHRVYITTNHGGSFPRERDDRRWVMHTSRVTKESTRAVLDPYCGNDLRGYLKRGGYYAVYKYLSEFDLSNYEPKWYDDEVMAESDQGVLGYEQNIFLVEALNEMARRDNIEHAWWTPEAPNERDYWPDVVCREAFRGLSILSDENYEEDVDSFMSPRGGFASRKWEHYAKDLGYIVVRLPDGSRFSSNYGGKDCAVWARTVWVRLTDETMHMTMGSLRAMARQYVKDLNLKFVRTKHGWHDLSLTEVFAKLVEDVSTPLTQSKVKAALDRMNDTESVSDEESKGGF